MLRKGDDKNVGNFGCGRVSPRFVEANQTGTKLAAILQEVTSICREVGSNLFETFA